ncbi:hypothetical protein EYF80_024197 [Liparis tanakae]|uniref:Uncharacterized protein n=1 Tax=Liparis tanakae TaxID=230148 RepID=A0A4Z2HHY4_9TELE|nr:hypothetical protein EYF80_024197 [Liparis tanakae]
MVYRMVPFFMMRKSLLGAVMLLFSRRISMGPSYISLRSTHVCRKNTSIVYSCVDRTRGERRRDFLHTGKKKKKKKKKI